MKKPQRKKPARSVEESQIGRQQQDKEQLHQQLATEKHKCRELERDIKHACRQRAHLESELINNCGAVRVEYGDEKPARVLWPVDPVTGVGTHKANAKYAADVLARAVKAEAEAKRLSGLIRQLAQVRDYESAIRTGAI